MAIKKSALFMRQWSRYAQQYKDKARMDVAERFIAAVEETLHFIGQNPHACIPYDTGEKYEDLRAYQFRKWNLRGFPHLVLFRLKDDAIFVEVIYAHRMDIPSRFSTDKDLL